MELWLQGVGGGGNVVVLVKGYKVAVMQDEQILEIYMLFSIAPTVNNTVLYP